VRYVICVATAPIGFSLIPSGSAVPRASLHLRLAPSLTSGIARSRQPRLSVRGAQLRCRPVPPMLDHASSPTTPPPIPHRLLLIISKQDADPGSRRPIGSPIPYAHLCQRPPLLPPLGVLSTYTAAPPTSRRPQHLYRRSSHLSASSARVRNSLGVPTHFQAVRVRSLGSRPAVRVDLDGARTWVDRHLKRGGAGRAQRDEASPVHV